MITVQTQDAGSLSRVEVRKDNPHLVEHKLRGAVQHIRGHRGREVQCLG